MKTNPWMGVLSFAGVISTSIVLLALPGKREASDSGRSYRLEIEAAGFHEVATNDFAQIRDTLDHHLSVAAGNTSSLKYDWQMNGLPVDGSEGHVRTKLNLSFDSKDVCLAFLGAAFLHPDVKVSLLKSGIFGHFAKVDISLPVPGPQGHRLHLKGWNMHLRAWEERIRPLA